MALTATPSAMSQQRLAGKIGVFVEDDAAGNPDVFNPIGACITGATPPAKAREAVVASGCINIDTCGVLWDVGDTYVTDDLVNNAGQLYKADAGGTGGAAPVHTTGQVGDWIWVSASSAVGLVCTEIPVTTPGKQSESEFTFTTNHAPGSNHTNWFENEQECNNSYRWMLCYVNAVRQICPAAWVKSYTPDAFTEDSESMTATVVLSLTAKWTYSGGEA